MMEDLIITKKSTYDTKQLKVFSTKNELLTLGVNGENGKESMWVGITLEITDVQQLIDFLQKQAKKCRSQMYLLAYSAFDNYSVDDRQLNVSNNVESGICNFFEKRFNINLIKDLDQYPELKERFVKIDRNPYDGNIGPSNAEGAKLRVKILLESYNETNT